MAGQYIPRFHIHFMPGSASWLNRVQRFPRDLTSQWLRRRVFTIVAELNVVCDGYVAHRNDHPKTFIQTAKLRGILQEGRPLRRFGQVRNRMEHYTR